LFILDACALIAVLAMEKGADNLFNTMGQMPITIKDTLTDETFKEAGRLKSKYL
jgi:PIN domain nuclease of toxin-antitoxin system